jgi:hypothetical protein
MFQAVQSLNLMREHAKFLKDPLEIEKDAINMAKSEKFLREFFLSLIEMTKDKNQNQNIQKATQTKEDFKNFIMSKIKEINSKIEIEDDELDKIKQYADALKYKLITVFKNTKYLSQETIESIERLKQELTKNTSKLDPDNTLKDAMRHAIKLKVEIKNYMQLLSQEIEEKQKLLNNINKKVEKNKTSKNNSTSIQEMSESKKGSRTETLYRPIEMANLYKITHKDDKLKDLNKYITYSWMHNVKAYKTMREKLMRKYSELIERESIKLEKRRKKK